MGVIERVAATRVTRDTRTVPWLLVYLALGGIVATLLVNIFVSGFNGPSSLFAVAIDIQVYQAGAEHLWSGLPLYDGPVFPTPTIDLLFTYPPFSAVLFLPLVALGTTGLFLFAYIGNAILVATLIALCMRLLGYRYSASFWVFAVTGTVALLAIEPIRTTFSLGQINVLLALLVIADIARPRSGRFRGVGVGLAAGIKLTPLIFVVYLLVTKQWRAAGTALATFAATVVVGFIAMPGDAWKFWTDKVIHSGRVGAIDSMSNQSINGYVSQLLRLFDVTAYRDASSGVFEAPGWMWMPIALVVGVLGMWAARLMRDRGKDLLAISVVGMTGAAMSPFSWGHHWVWFVPLLLITLDRAVRAGGRDPWLWLPPAVIVVLTFVWWFPLPDRPGFDFGLCLMPRPEDPNFLQAVWFVMVCGLYPLLLLATLVAIFAGVWRTRQRAPVEEPRVARTGETDVVDGADVDDEQSARR